MHRHYNVAARLAQSVEHQTFNLRVKGSSPLLGDEFYKHISTKFDWGFMIHFLTVTVDNNDNTQNASTPTRFELAIF